MSTVDLSNKIKP